MVRSRLSSQLFWLVLIFVYSLLGEGMLTRAQAQSPSADQMEMFRNLPPDQQQAILESMTQGGSASGVRRDRELQFPRTVRPRTDRDQSGDQLDDQSDDSRFRATSREPRFKGDDTLLLFLEIRQYEQRFDERVQPSSQDQQFPAQPPIPGRQAEQSMPEQGSRRDGKDERKEIERTEQDRQRLEDLRERIQRRNPYKLDKWGILHVPDLGPIPLSGLTVEQATQRLNAEGPLKDFVVRIIRLPLRPTGTEALKPFGYELFSGIPSTFAPATDIPVPSAYVVGPGDSIEVQLIGNTRGRYSLVVGRDGRINFPELGPIPVSGQRFEQVRTDLESRVREQMIGTQASVGMGELRSVRVFVLGDAETPGSYTVSGLSTITNALFVSGGVKKIGSLRNIQLKRSGRTVTTLDLYDLLLNGDTSADARLLPGDVIFIPPVGATVGLAGEVRRPAIYELKNETTASELLRLGGGLTSDADPAIATIERVNEQRQRVTVDVNLTTATGQKSVLQGGDLVRVPAIRPVLEDSVSLDGFVYRPGQFEFTPGMRLTDLLPSLDELQPNADQRYLLIRRETPPDRRIAVFSADLVEAIAEPNSAANFELAPRDRIYVFDQETGRDRIIEPLMRELQMQSRTNDPTREVSVAGKVKAPGRYPLELGMRVSDLLRAGGSLDESAYVGEAEITRYTIDESGERQAELIEIDLQGVLNGQALADIPLQPFDYLLIKEVPLWAAQEEVEIRGEVRYPGRYPIHRGETLRSVMQRAGGFTDLAFLEGAVFTRDELKERERKQLDILATRMESDLAQVSLMAAQETGKDAGQALAVGQSLLSNLRNLEPVGRLVIDVGRSATTRPGSEQDIVLKDGDRLLVPRVTQEVTVMGEVQSTTSHLFRPELSRDDYIAMSGGLTARADDDHIYVVRADGSVVTQSGKRWFNGGGAEIRPGDTVVVPLNTERMRPLPFWTAVTTIIYNLAISAAAVNSF